MSRPRFPLDALRSLTFSPQEIKIMAQDNISRGSMSDIKDLLSLLKGFQSPTPPKEGEQVDSSEAALVALAEKLCEEEEQQKPVVETPRDVVLQEYVEEENKDEVGDVDQLEELAEKAHPAYFYDYIHSRHTSDVERYRAIYNDLEVNPIYSTWKIYTVDPTTHLQKTVKELWRGQLIPRGTDEGTTCSQRFLREQVCWSIPSPRVLRFLLSLSSSIIDLFCGRGYWINLFRHYGGPDVSIVGVDDFTEMDEAGPNGPFTSEIINCNPLPLDQWMCSRPELIKGRALFFSWVRHESQDLLEQCVDCGWELGATHIFFIGEYGSDLTAALCLSKDDPHWEMVKDVPLLPCWVGVHDELCVWKRREVSEETPKAVVIA